jgi:RNA polymerase sigma-70 factor (ECF subfamily)
MRPHRYAQLCAIARLECGDPAGAEDVVQDALLAAVIAGRTDLNDPANGRWLNGVVRNRARMALRGTRRRQHRETEWQSVRHEPEAAQPNDTAEILKGLPPSLKAIAALALSGHNRREISYLLRLEDTALRQRVASLKSKLRTAGIGLPPGLPGLNLDLAYGRIRDALLPLLLRQGGTLASHDPDGHLFVVRARTGKVADFSGSDARQKNAIARSQKP